MAEEGPSICAAQEARRPSPPQAIIAAVQHLNCTLDACRARFSSALPLLRPRPLLSLQGQPRSKLHPRPLSFHGSPFAAAIPGDGVVEQVFTSGISSFLNLYNTVLIGRIILTWFPSAPPAIVTPLSTVTDPYLNLFRGIIPPLGGTLDLSPILAFVVLDLFTNAAAALPCELAAGSEPKQRKTGFRRLTPSQLAVAFQRRQAAQRRRRQAQEAQARAA